MKKYDCANCKRFKKYNGDYKKWKASGAKANCTCNCPRDFEAISGKQSDL